MKLLCADDLIGPKCLADELAVLEANPEVAMVASRRDFISSDGDVVLRNRGLDGLIGHHEPADVVETVIRSGINPIGWPSALLLRRADFEAVGGFDPRWLHPIDLDLWLRLLSRGSFVGLDRCLASFRISGESVTARIRDSGAQHRAVLRSFASESPWPISRRSLLRGGLRSRVEQVRLRLLFAAVNSRHQAARRLPALVLERGRSGALQSEPGSVALSAGLDAGVISDGNPELSHRRSG